MPSEDAARDHINVVHPDTAKRFKLNIRGEVGRLSLGKLKDCLAQSRCQVPRARMVLSLNGTVLANDRDVCGELGIRSGTTLTVEDAECDRSVTRSSKASTAERPQRPGGESSATASNSHTRSSNVAPGKSHKGPSSAAAMATLNSLPRRQLELQTLDAQDDLVHHDRWRRDEAIDATLSQLDASLAESAAKRNALSNQKELAERALRGVVGREQQLKAERDRLAQLQQDEADRAREREHELAARRAELRREQEAIRAVALLKLENEQRQAHIAHIREQYEAQRRRGQEEQAALDAQYRERVLAVTTRQLALEQQQLAQQREADELAWERHVMDEQRATYTRQAGGGGGGVSRGDDARGRSRSSTTGPTGFWTPTRGEALGEGTSTPRPASHAPTSHPYRPPFVGSARPYAQNGAEAEDSDNDRDGGDRDGGARRGVPASRDGPAGINHSHRDMRDAPVEQNSPFRYRGSHAPPARYAGGAGGGGAPAAAQTTATDASTRGSRRRSPGRVATMGMASAPPLPQQQQQTGSAPYVVERPSIRHQNDGLSVSRETESASQPRKTGTQPTSSSSASPYERPGAVGAHKAGQAGGQTGGPGGVRDAWAPQPLPSDTADTSISTAAERLTNISSGATSLGPAAPSFHTHPSQNRNNNNNTHPRQNHNHHHSAEPAQAGYLVDTGSPRHADPSPSASLVVMEDGGYYAPEENAAENLHRLGEALGFTGADALAFDRNHTCIVNLSDAYTLLVTYDASTERLYVYSTLLTAPSLQHDEKLRLGLYEMLLQGSLLGREVCGGGISASMKKDFILMSTSLFMPTSQPWSLRTLVPSFLHALQHWREQVAAYMVAQGHAVPVHNDESPTLSNTSGFPRTADAAPLPSSQSRPQDVPAESIGEDRFASHVPRHSGNPRGISVLRHELANGSGAGGRGHGSVQSDIEPPSRAESFRDVPVLGVDVTDSLIVNGVPTRYKDGVLVLQVAGPAATAGLRPHDFVEQLNDVAIDSTATFGRVVRALVPGAVANLRIVRSGLPLVVSVRVGASRILVDA